MRLSLCVCLSVSLSVREHISGTAGWIFTKFCVQIPCGCVSVLFQWRYATLCTSGFMDDITFGCNGREACKGCQHSASAINYVRDQGGVWCLWMLVWFVVRVHNRSVHARLQVCVGSSYNLCPPVDPKLNFYILIPLGPLTLKGSWNQRWICQLLHPHLWWKFDDCRSATWRDNTHIRIFLWWLSKVGQGDLVFGVKILEEIVGWPILSAFRADCSDLYLELCTQIVCRTSLLVDWANRCSNGEM